MPLTPQQIRAARALLNWSRPQLARKVGVSLSTILRSEEGTARPVTLRAIQAVLEDEGVEFVPNGARLKNRPTLR
jgi:transcriptional regulator with XRE-family HTH domain